MLQAQSRYKAGNGIRRTAGRMISVAYGRPSDENRAGGDFCDVVRREDGTVTFAVGDTSAKSRAGRQHASFLRASYRRAIDSSLAPAEIINIMNADYLSFLRNESNLFAFASIFVATFSGAREITYASGGAPSGLIMRGEHWRELRPTGMIIGVNDDESYEQRSLSLDARDTVVVFTDGVFECFSQTSPHWMLDNDAIALDVRRISISGLPISARAVIDHAAAFHNDGFVDDATVLVCSLEPI